MAAIELRDIIKRFGDTTVVDRFNLHVSAGEFIVLVGASGCGKSTTLRMIAGLESPTSGAISIDGRDVTRVEPKDRDIAMVFQNYALYPHMNVAENMSFSLQIARASKTEIDRRVQAAAKILSIENLLQRRPRELSGGQRQRVAMGRAIVREPKVFLFDEPLSNLDAKLRAQMRVELALLHERLGKTVVYVTHDQVEAMTLASRIVVMDQGKAQQVGTPEQVFMRPCNQFVAGFIGSPQMNFLRATVEQGRLTGTGFSFTPVEPLASALVGRERVETNVGVRPHALMLGEGPNQLRVKIRVAEYLGAETMLVGTLDQTESPFTVAVPGNHLGLVHQTQVFHIPSHALYGFDAASGANLVAST